MELELVSLPCQTVNSLGAATRAINPLLVLQFSTQPRTAINNRPLSKVDQQPSSISPGFPELSEIPFYIVIFFFPPSPPSPSCGDPDFRCPSSLREDDIDDNKKSERRLPRSRGEGNQSSLIGDVGIQGFVFECFECFLKRS